MKAGSIEIVSVTETTVVIVLSPIDGATSYQLALRPEGGSTSYYSIPESVVGIEFTLSGLTPNTTYTINYRGVSSGTYGPFITPSGPTFYTGQQMPDPWEWWSTIEVGAPINVSAAEWNAFTARVDEVRNAFGLVQWTSYTTVYSGEAMEASVAEDVREAIGGLLPVADSSLDPGWIESGKPITAAFFLGLRDYLNSAIYNA